MHKSQTDAVYETTSKKYATTSWGPSDILAKELAFIVEANKDPALTPKIIRCYDTVTKLDAYLYDTATPPSDLLQTVLADHYAEPWEENEQKGLTPYLPSQAMITGPYSGRFLQMMAEITRAKRITEIGMLTGYSAISFAQSPFCEEMVALDMVPYLKGWVESRIAGTKVEDKFRIMIDRAEVSLVTLKNEGKQFELIFFDADKPGYIKYYMYIMDNNLLSKTGIILCDNVLWNGDPYMEVETVPGKSLKEFVQFVKNDERVTQVICPVRDGILIIKHKVH